MRSTAARRWRRGNCCATGRRQDRERRLFFCQREAIETLIYLAEMRFTGRTGRLRFTPKLTDDDLGAAAAWCATRAGVRACARRRTSSRRLIDKPADPALLPLRRLCTKLATGSGKTLVAAMLITWAFVNRGISPDSREYPDVVLVCAPNLTVKERLGVLRPEASDNYYDAFDLVPAKWRPLLQRGIVSWRTGTASRPKARTRKATEAMPWWTRAKRRRWTCSAASFAKRRIGCRSW